MATKTKKRPTKVERDRNAALSAMVKIGADRDAKETLLRSVEKTRDEYYEELTGVKRELEMKKRHIVALERGNDRLQDEITRLTEDNRSFFSLLKSEREKRPTQHRPAPAAINTADVAATIHAAVRAAGGSI
jgi:chromosome segregation ATPase